MPAASKSQNTAKTQKRKAPPTAWQKGQSGNPGGRPKNQQSITYWLNEFGNMTPVQAGKLFKLLARELDKGGDELPVFAIVALRTLVSLMNEPTPGLIAQVLDRTEGKVADKLILEDWRAEAAKYGADPDALVAELFSKVNADPDAE